MQSLENLNRIVGTLLSLPSAGVVIVYEDFVAGLKAKQLFSQFLNPLDAANKQRIRMWDFSGLRVDSLRKSAVRDAAAADVLCISAKGDAELPAGVKAWAEKWAGERGAHHCTMVVLLDTVDTVLASKLPIVQFLHGIAAKGNAEFLVAPLDPFGAPASLPANEPANHR